MTEEVTKEFVDKYNATVLLQFYYGFIFTEPTNKNKIVKICRSRAEDYLGIVCPNQRSLGYTIRCIDEFIEGNYMSYMSEFATYRTVKQLCDDVVARQEQSLFIYLYPRLFKFDSFIELVDWLSSCVKAQEFVNPIIETIPNIADNSSRKITMEL
jgi:hypothetical protein